MAATAPSITPEPPPGSADTHEFVQVGALHAQDTWLDEDGTRHTWRGVLLEPGFLAEARDEGRAR